MSKKHLNIDKARRLEESIALFSRPGDIKDAIEKYSNENFMLTKAKGVIEPHPDSDRFIEALNQMYSAMLVVNEILAPECIIGKQFEFVKDTLGESYPIYDDVTFFKGEKFVVIENSDIDSIFIAISPVGKLDQVFIIEKEEFFENTKKLF